MLQVALLIMASAGNGSKVRTWGRAEHHENTSLCGHYSKGQPHHSDEVENKIFQITYGKVKIATNITLINNNF